MMFETRRIDGGTFAAADATWAPGFVSPDPRSSRVEDARSLQGATVDRGVDRASVRNVIVHDVRISDQDVAWRSTARLRVTLERFENGDVIAYLVGATAFVGHGRGEREAIADMMDEIAHELRFYREVDESELTMDAQETKQMLSDRFEASVDR